MPKAPEPKPKSGFGDLLADIGKRHGVKVGALSEVVTAVEGLTTDNLAVDYAAGVGGLPVGRVTELYGPPSCGKTTTALQTAARLQYKIIKEDLDQFILYEDFEKAIDPDYCANLGLDVEHPSFILVRPTYLEQGGEIANELLGTGKVKLLIVDSVASMAPRALLDGDFDQRTTAMNRARLLSGWLLRLIGQLDEHNACAVFINHLMETIDVSGGRQAYLPPRESTPGGKGLKFYSSLRLKYEQVGKVKGTADDALANARNDMQVATKTKVTVTKNKVGVPFRQVEIRVTHGRGFDNVWSALQVLYAHKRITKNGAWHIVKDDVYPELAHPELPEVSGKHQFQGEPALLAFAESHAVFAERLIAAAKVLISDCGGAPLEVGRLDPPPGDAEGDWA